MSMGVTTTEEVACVQRERFSHSYRVKNELSVQRALTHLVLVHICLGDVAHTQYYSLDFRGGRGEPHQLHVRGDDFREKNITFWCSLRGVCFLGMWRQFLVVGLILREGKVPCKSTVLPSSVHRCPFFQGVIHACSDSHAGRESIFVWFLCVSLV